MMNRRDLMRVVPAALIPVAVLATCQPVQARAVDPHPEWLREWQAVCARWSDLLDKYGDDTPESEQAWDRRIELNHLIGTIRATTTAGVAAQIAWMKFDLVDELCDPLHCQAMQSAVESLAGIAA